MNSSLYIHIPFCKKLCGYCDFFKTMSLAKKSEVLARIAEEMRERAPMLDGTVLKTIYFGGGTPTVCSPEELGALLACARDVFDCSEVEEVTVEANPDDLTAEYIGSLRRTAVNRVSLGVQSFDDEELRFMNRRHTAEEASQAVKRLQDAGIGNITIDLIFGVDGFGEDVLERRNQENRNAECDRERDCENQHLVVALHTESRAVMLNR